MARLSTKARRRTVEVRRLAFVGKDRLTVPSDHQGSDEEQYAEAP
jgi:hypothetical protein